MTNRFLLCFVGCVFLCRGAFATTTVRAVPTAQQAALYVTTDQATEVCSVAVWTVNASGSQAPANDVNPKLFGGSDRCEREGNFLNAPDLILVVGKRSAELDESGISKTSRSLQTLTKYFYKVTVGSDVVNGDFTTGNVPIGNTYNDPVYDRFKPGEYAYPTMDWTPAGKSKVYVDPLTGIGVKRMSGPGELIPSVQTGLTFMSAAARDASWTINGLSAVYRGSPQQPNVRRISVTPKVFYRIADPSWPGGAFGKSADYVSLVLAGAASSSGGQINICLTNDGVNCAGATVQQTLKTKPADYTIGDTVPILKFWQNSPSVPSNMHDIRTRGGKATLAGTNLTWESGDGFSPKVGAGGFITLDGTDCVISSLVHEKLIVLQPGQSGNCARDNSFAFTQRNWGFLIWDAAPGANTLTIASATWNAGTSGYSTFPPSGGYDLCSPVNTPGPTGVGHLCVNSSTVANYSSANTIFWIGEDGTANPLGESNGNLGALAAGGLCSSGTGWAWDRTTPGQYYCVGTRTSDKAAVIFSVRYTGTYRAAIVEQDSRLSPAITTVISDDLSKLVAAFAPAFGVFTPNSGWKLIGRQRDNLIFECLQTYQNSPAWVAVFNIPQRKIISAFSTFGGSAGATNRWGTSHSVFTTGDTDWILISAGNPFDLPFEMKITGGALTSNFAPCPQNPFGVTGTQCSEVTISSIIPTNPANGGTLFGQPLLPGDFLSVTLGGADDGEQVRVMAMNDTRIWVQRAVRTYYYGLKNNHSGDVALRVLTGALHELWVNYVDDPFAQAVEKPYGWTVLEDPKTVNCHQVYSMGLFLAGCLKQVPGVPQIPGAAIRLGALPTSSSTTNPWNNPVYSNGMNAGFSDAKYIVAPVNLENHPSRSQYNTPDDPTSLDARPYLGDQNIATSQTTSKVGTYTYKVSAAGMRTPSNPFCASCVLNYRVQPLLVTSGTHPVVDTSPQLTDTPDANYTYCYVVVGGDCWSGSQAGELYVNVPYAAVPYCYSSRFATPASLSDICVTANTNTAHRVFQSANPNGDDSAGAYTRRLTSFFSSYKTEDIFWNVRATPNGKWAFGNITNIGDARAELMMFALPPFPEPDSMNQGTFADIAVPVRGNTAAAKVRARFGYAENGKVSKYFCTSRQVECTTSGAPFVWADEPQKVQECVTDCTLHIPALPGRMLYYLVERSTDGKQWTPEKPKVAPVVKTEARKW
ncbi:MAG: hypothetical protein ABI811_18515 [Acidobacteriota bacterium]